MAVSLTTTLRTSLLMILIALQLSLTAKSNEVCSDPKTVKNTKMNQYSGSYKVYSHLRYICEDGYKRQAGTSNIAICLIDDKTNKAAWKYGNISCIRDPLVPVTTPSNTISSFTTSVSSSSHVSTSSSTMERYSTMTSTPTVKIQETPHSTHGKVTQTSQIPTRTPVIRLSTIKHHTAPGRTQSPELRFTQTLLPKETVKAITEQTTVSASTEATTTENTGVTAKVKQSTATHFIVPVQTTNIIDNPNSSWQKSETIVTVGSTVVIILLVGIIILIVCCKKRRSETSCLVETQIPLQNTISEDHFPASHKSNKDTEDSEETFL
ncbi:interleukin-15 receptor subunit alpha isoform X2 [Phyllobates terribilis]|uniref:interleukin-15 receptor subunit alpha isoform X2 n=1 Tax=Phyllobates terribilis TaxID=111132 RepID=UPI003CCAF2F7